MQERGIFALFWRAILFESMLACYVGALIVDSTSVPWRLVHFVENAYCRCRMPFNKSACLGLEMPALECMGFLLPLGLVRFDELLFFLDPFNKKFYPRTFSVGYYVVDEQNERR